MIRKVKRKNEVSSKDKDRLEHEIASKTSSYNGYLTAKTDKLKHLI